MLNWRKSPALLMKSQLHRAGHVSRIRDPCLLRSHLPSRRKGSKETIQGLFEKIPWSLSHRLPSMVHPSRESWQLVSHHQLCCLHLRKHLQSHPRGQKAREEKMQHYAIKPWVDLQLLPVCPILVLSTKNMTVVNIDNHLLDLFFTKPSDNDDDIIYIKKKKFL